MKDRDLRLLLTCLTLSGVQYNNSRYNLFFIALLHICKEKWSKQQRTYCKVSSFLDMD